MPRGHGGGCNFGAAGGRWAWGLRAMVANVLIAGCACDTYRVWLVADGVCEGAEGFDRGLEGMVMVVVMWW